MSEGCASLIITVDRQKRDLESPVAGRTRARWRQSLKETIKARSQAHGGPDKIGLCYAMEDMSVVERKIAGCFNTVRVLGKSHDGKAVSGERRARRRALGDRQRRVLKYAHDIPCWRLGVRMTIRGLSRFTEALRPAYLRIIR